MRSLHVKLIVTFLVLITAIGAGYFALTLHTTRLYFQEAHQKLNRGIAAQIVKETRFFDGDTVDASQMDDLFHTLMVINPSIEFYLTDPDGALLAYNAPMDRIVRDRVSLEPVRTFLNQPAQWPVLGDDPRHPYRQKPFSAAPVYVDGNLRGYLYAILGGESFDTAAGLLEKNYILRRAATIGLIGLIATLGAGWVVFHWLTRRLRRLTDDVASFRNGQFQVSLPADTWRRGGRGDEIDELGQTVAEMSERITDQIAQLEQAETVRRDMLVNVSHDLRTPMTTLQGYLDTLQMKEAELSDEERHAFLKRAMAQCEQLSRLTAEIFDLSMLEAGERVPVVEPFSLAELVQDVAQKFALDSARKGVRLETSIAGNLPFVSADIALIERVLDNLIDNALKHTGEGGSIHLNVESRGGNVGLEVVDTGIGIGKKDIPNIFDRFYQAAHNGRSGTAGKGTGLGLAIVRRILQLHDAAIQVASEPEHGTRFSFRLPAATPAE